MSPAWLASQMSVASPMLPLPKVTMTVCGAGRRSVSSCLCGVMCRVAPVSKIQSSLTVLEVEVAVKAMALYCWLGLKSVLERRCSACSRCGRISSTVKVPVEAVVVSMTVTTVSKEDGRPARTWHATSMSSTRWPAAVSWSCSALARLVKAVTVSLVAILSELRSRRSCSLRAKVLAAKVSCRVVQAWLDVVQRRMVGWCTGLTHRPM